VTIAYRRRLIDSPAYTLNHEEVGKALEEGIRFAEGLTPIAVDVDDRGRACALQVSEQHNDGDGVWHEHGRSTLAARTILIITGKVTMIIAEIALGVPGLRIAEIRTARRIAGNENIKSASRATISSTTPPR